MSVYIMGDIHMGSGKHDEDKLFKLNALPEDVAIICGDFGAVWHDDDHPGGKDWHNLQALATLSFTIAFVQGNHENYTALAKYPDVEKWGGSVKQLRENIFMLKNGGLYTIEGKNYWTCGGAASVDKAYRIEGKSWWKEEVPTDVEIDAACDVYMNNHVDYAITHTPPHAVNQMIYGPWLKIYADLYMTERFQWLMEQKPDVLWYSGHQHIDFKFKNCNVLYDKVVKI